MKFNKVFFIGLNKTGTYSIYKYLTDNNFKALHHRKDGMQKGYWYQKDVDYFKSHDIFITDFEHYDKEEIYLDLDFLNINFPNSIFILNTRNLDKWLLSRFTHNKPSYYNENKNKLDENDLLRWTNFRNNYYRKVEIFFKHKTLYKINIENEPKNALIILNNIFNTNINKLPLTHQLSLKLKKINKEKIILFLKKYVNKKYWESDFIIELLPN